MGEEKKFSQGLLANDAAPDRTSPEDSAEDACLNFSIAIPEGLTSEDVLPVMVVLGARNGKVLVIAREGVEVAELARQILQHESQATEAGEIPTDERPPPGALFH